MSHRGRARTARKDQLHRHIEASSDRLDLLDPGTELGPPLPAVPHLVEQRRRQRRARRRLAMMSGKPASVTETRIRDLQLPRFTLEREVRDQVAKLPASESWKKRIFLEAVAEAQHAVDLDPSVAIRAEAAVEAAGGVTYIRYRLADHFARLWRSGVPSSATGSPTPGDMHRPYPAATWESIRELVTADHLENPTISAAWRLPGASVEHYVDPIRPPLEAIALVAKHVRTDRVLLVEGGRAAAAQALSLMQPSAHVYTASEICAPAEMGPPEDGEYPPFETVVVNVPPLESAAWTWTLLHGPPEVRARRRVRQLSRTAHHEFADLPQRLVEYALGHVGPHTSTLVLMANLDTQHAAATTLGRRMVRQGPGWWVTYLPAPSLGPLRRPPRGAHLPGDRLVTLWSRS